MNFNKLQGNNSFFEHAKAYLAHNWSLIPVWGTSKPDSFKVAAVRWSPFNRRFPTQKWLHDWFVFAGYRGIAIVTGRISGIAVLDFDSETLYRKFRQLFPHLTSTYTVKTPNGWHLYFQIPTQCNTRTRKGQDIDWQWEKRYVVAPPTQGYTLQNEQNPRLLSQQDINTIEAFIDGEKPLITAYQTQVTGDITERELQTLYSKQAATGQRNNTLFNTGLLARDNGWSLKDTISALVNLHTYNQQAGESDIARQREAIATLTSAFSRPPRKIEDIQQLPNTIREKFLEMKQTGTIRLIEGLRLKGYETGTLITWQQAWAELDGIVGRDTIINAFNATTEEGRFIFEKFSGYGTPTGLPAQNANAAINSPEGNDHKCLMVTDSNSGKTQMTGRPTYYFRLPSNVELARILGVPLSSITDVLSLEDLKSAKTTRQALHYGYIQRRPGKYATKWLAQRLGVSKVTKNRYDKAFKDLHKLATYSQKAIYWNNLNDISDKYDVPGQFLEDDTGKRYPAKLVIAVKLLKEKRKIKLLTRGFNYYWVGHKFGVDAEALVTTIKKSRKLPEPDFSNYWRTFDSQPAAQIFQRRSNQDNSEDSGTSATPYSQSAHETLKSHTPSVQNSRTGEQHSTVDNTTLEADAIYIQEYMNRMVSAPEHKLSLHNARQLLKEYGWVRVMQSMNRVAARQHVKNPTGLLIAILRSEARKKELERLAAGQ